MGTYTPKKGTSRAKFYAKCIVRRGEFRAEDLMNWADRFGWDVKKVRSEIQWLCKKGVLKRLERGLYQVAGMKSVPKDYKDPLQPAREIARKVAREESPDRFMAITHASSQIVTALYPLKPAERRSVLVLFFEAVGDPI